MAFLLLHKGCMTNCGFRALFSKTLLPPLFKIQTVVTERHFAALEVWEVKQLQLELNFKKKILGNLESSSPLGGGVEVF